MSFFNFNFLLLIEMFAIFQHNFILTYKLGLEAFKKNFGVGAKIYFFLPYLD